MIDQEKIDKINDIIANTVAKDPKAALVLLQGLMGIVADKEYFIGMALTHLDDDAINSLHRDLCSEKYAK